VQKRGVAVTNAMNSAALGVGAVLKPLFEAASALSRRTSGLQCLNCLLTMTTLASPNTLISCASFLAKSL
jgi:hypothetical protein